MRRVGEKWRGRWTVWLGLWLRAGVRLLGGDVWGRLLSLFGRRRESPATGGLALIRLGFFWAG